jgi:hypothetical protein
MIIVSIEWLSKEKAFFLLQGVLRGGAPGGSIAAVCWCNARNVKYACEESKARQDKTREDKTKTHAPCR